MVFEYEARIPKSRHIFQEIVLQVQIIVKKIPNHIYMHNIQTTFISS